MTGPTQILHELAFDMYESLAVELGCETYRKLPVLSVQPGKGGQHSFRGGGKAGNQAKSSSIVTVPQWLNGNVGRISVLGYGGDTAQVTPAEFTFKFIEESGATVILGTCTGVTTTGMPDNDEAQITGVTYKALGEGDIDGCGDRCNDKTIPCDTVIVCAGPWSCAAEDWFDSAVSLPMEGIKSTSIVWSAPEDESSVVDATALFCGEDDRYHTHLEVYPRPDGTIYLCGIGGSDYISRDELKTGAFRDSCDAKEDRVEAARLSFQDMSTEYKNQGKLDRIQACMRPCPPDALPYMGKIPGHRGAFINAGHNCWGIAWAPACGKAMAELVLEGCSKSVNLTPFDPCRFNPVIPHGGRGRKRRGANVGEQW